MTRSLSVIKRKSRDRRTSRSVPASLWAQGQPVAAVPMSSPSAVIPTPTIRTALSSAAIVKFTKMPLSSVTVPKPACSRWRWAAALKRANGRLLSDWKAKRRITRSPWVTLRKHRRWTPSPSVIMQRPTHSVRLPSAVTTIGRTVERRHTAVTRLPSVAARLPAMKMIRQRCIMPSLSDGKPERTAKTRSHWAELPM